MTPENATVDEPAIDAPPAEPAQAGPSRGAPPSPLARVERLVPVLAWLAGSVLFYREVLTSGFDQLQGNIGDQRLLAYLSEHWYLVVRGHAAWRDPSYFFPARGVLGYSDALFLYQPVYVPLRALGVDQFAAFQITVMVVTSIGFAATYLLLRRALGVRVGLAAVGALVFCFGNNMTVASGHGQLMAVQLLPVLALLAVGAGRSLRDGRTRRAAALAAALGLLTALLLFTSFYVGFYALLTAAVALLATSVCAWPVVRRALAVVRSAPKTCVLVVAAAALSFGAGLVPFLITYIPVLDTSGGRDFTEALNLAPRLGDLWNVGPDNLLWSDVLGTYGPHHAELERALALTPLFVVSTLVGLVVLLAWRRSGADRLRVRTALASAVTAVVLVLLVVRVGDHTPWHTVWRLVPGATAIRALGRIELVAALPLVMAWAVLADCLWGAARRRRGGPRWLLSAAVAVVAVVVALEQVTTSGMADLDRSAQRALLEVSPPPSACSSFYVVDPSGRRPLWAIQVDAMLISHVVGIPTLNGYSGLAPQGWFLYDPRSPTYEAEVAAWIDRSGAPAGVCSFDLAARRWTAGAGAATD